MTYQSPGVYIEEVPSGPQPIAAASTSVIAVVGNTRKGPFKKPIRITGWADFVRTFGAAHSDGFTAEAIYGFFENGGPAAWVVRVDDSDAAAWEVRDSTPATSFIATATSGGEWAANVALGIAPDTSSGAGSLGRAVVSTAVDEAAGEVPIPVESSGGIAPGDAVVLLDGGGGTVAATVSAVDQGLVTVASGSAVELEPGDVVAVQAPASTTLTLPAASGIKPGDLLVIQAPDGSRDSVMVNAVDKHGSGLRLTLAAPLASAVPAAGLAPRRTQFQGNIDTPTGPTFNLGNVTWQLPTDLRPRNTDTQTSEARATVSTGAIAPWGGSNFVMPGGQDVPLGPVTIEAQVRVAVYAEAITPFSPGDEAGVLSRFDFLPVNTSLVLTGPDGSATVTRDAADSATATGVALTSTFDHAAFALPNDASHGVVVRCAVEPQVGEFVDFEGDVLRITGVEPATSRAYVLSFADATDIHDAENPDTGRFPLLAYVPTRVFPMRFRLTVNDGGAAVETYSGLSLSQNHPQYFARDGVINGVSAYISVDARADDAPAISATSMPALAVATQAGVDRPASNADYKAGLEQLEKESEPAMIMCPDSVRIADPLLQADLVGAVVTHAEEFRRFAIIDAPDLGDQELLAWRNTTLSSTYAAMFAPHVRIVTIDPDSMERFTTVPPSGFIGGVMARTDRERGVHKAPGNERINGIVGLTQEYTQRRQDLLNPNSVNLVRAFPGRGTRVWGARNATDDVTWRYINVRRLFNFVETSVENGTQWVVFEPNTASTWIRIKVSLENFLDQLWRSGALAGSTPEEAYRVRVGLGETMQEVDIDLGQVITEVSIAPAKPAEFVVFRFSHKRLSE